MDEPEPYVSARIETIEAVLEDLHAQLETCRQAMILSRAAIGLGLGTIALVFTLATAYCTAPVVLTAFTAVIGGLVWLGANKSTRDELLVKRADAESEMNRLFDRVAARSGWATSDAPTYH